MPKGNVPAPKAVAKATQPKEEKKTQAAVPKKAAKEQLKAKQQAPKVVEEESEEEEEIVKVPVKNTKAPQQKKAEKKSDIIEEEDDEEDEDFEGEVIEEENSEDEEEEIEEDDEDGDADIMEAEDDEDNEEEEDEEHEDLEGDDDIYIPKKKAKVTQEKEKVTKGHERSQKNAPGKKVVNDDEIVAQAEKNKKNKADRFSKQQKDVEAPQRGILYIGHLPYGFVEEGIKEYFSQYGDILNIHLARSKKNARSRGFAFIEFKFKEVAKIAADSMNGYMLYGKKIVCRVLEDDEGVKVKTKKFKYIPYNKIFIVEKNREKEPRELRKEIKNLVKNEEKKRQKLKELNINYEFPGFKSLVTKAQGTQ